MAALPVGQAALVENLEQHVEEVGVRLLDLVEEDDGIGPAAHRLGKLAALVVADVSRRGADELGDGVLLHELGHVEGDERVLAAKEELRERLGELGLAHARGAEEDERATGAARVLERAAAASDGACHLGHGLVLPNDALVEHVLAAQELGGLGLGEVRDGNAGDARNDVGDVILIDFDDVVLEPAAPRRLELIALGYERLLLVAQARGVLELLGLGRRRLLLAGAGELGVDLSNLRGQHHAVHARARAGLIEHVDRLVGQEPVLNIAAREGDGGLDCGVGVAHVMVLLVAVLEACDDLEGVLDRRLPDIHRLEAALEGSVLLDVFAVLLGSGRADDLDLAARKGRLKDRGGVDGPLGRAGADHGVNLVDKEDVLLRLLELAHDLLHALLELAAILGAGDQRGHVKRPDLLSAQDIRHVARADKLRQPLNDGGFADTGIAQDKRIVLLTAGEDLHDALNLGVAADHGVEAALGRLLREVAPVLLEHRLVVGCSLGARGSPHADEDLAHVSALLGTVALILGDELVDGIADSVGRKPHGPERVHGAAVALRDDAQQKMLGRDVGLAMGHGLAIGTLKHALRAGREGYVAAGNGLGLLGGQAAHRRKRLVVGHVELGEGLRGDAFLLFDQAEEQVLGAYIHLAQRSGLVLRKADDLACFVGELLEHEAVPLDMDTSKCVPAAKESQTRDTHRQSSRRAGKKCAPCQLAAATNLRCCRSLLRRPRAPLR